MRRKSTRNASKTVEKPPVEVPVRKSRRRSKRRKRSSSSSSNDSDDVSLKTIAQQQAAGASQNVKSNLPEDETPEQPVWTVTQATIPSDGEIQKLKICLTRPSPSSPEKSERSIRHHRNKSGSQNDEDAGSSEERVTRRTRHRSSPAASIEEHEEECEEAEDKRGKGKSKTKHKSKSEKAPQIVQDVQDEIQSEISENVQVTPQSPQAAIDIRVDNENVPRNECETIDSGHNESNLHLQITHVTDTSGSNDGELISQYENETSQTTTFNVQNDSDETEEQIQETVHQTQEIDEPQDYSLKTQTEVNDQAEKSEDTSETCEQNVTMEISNESQSEVIEIPDTPDCEFKEKEQPMETEQNQEQTCSVEDNTEAISEPNQEKHVDDEVYIVEASGEKEMEAEDPKEVVLSNEIQTVLSTKSNEEQESRYSPDLQKDLSTDTISMKSITLEESHHSDEDSRSVDAAMMETNSSKEETSFTLTSSFNADIQEITQANTELQSMKDEVCQLFESPPQAKQRKRRWGNSSISLPLMQSNLTIITMDVIKEFCPNLQFLNEDEVKIDIGEARDKRKTSTDYREKRMDRKVSIDYRFDSGEQKRFESQSSVNSLEMEEMNEPELDNSNIIAMNRKISIVDDTASKLKPPPSPSKNPTSEVLHITNLVRPFTLKALKELLERTGKIKENGFWTNRIKSQCYVHYETTEEAEATRNALHGVHWPIGNGKKLMIQFATPEDLEEARKPPPVVPESKTTDTENQENQMPETRRPEEAEKVIKEGERHRTEGHVREWDIGKEDLHKTRSRSRDHMGRSERHERHKHRRTRTPSPPDDFMNRKQRKKEEDIPQKLMDDLFRKTKATPSIYWLPLTPDEIATKQQQRLLRMAEHKRRMEETSRGRGDYGRGAPYRRRYD